MRAFRLLVLVLLSFLLLGEPGGERSTVTISWDPPTPEEGVTGYQLYAITNLPTAPQWSWNTSLTNWVTYFPVPASNWIRVWTTNAPAVSTRITVDSMPFYGNGYRGPWFLMLTASNLTAESDPSNVVWMPKKPVSRDRRLQIGL